MLGFLIAAIAGFLTPQLEAPVAGPIAKALEGSISIAPGELRLVAFMAALLGAAILAALLSSGTTFGVILGAVLGYFGTRIFHALKKVIEARGDAD